MLFKLLESYNIPDTHNHQGPWVIQTRHRSYNSSAFDFDLFNTVASGAENS